MDSLQWRWSVRIVCFQIGSIFYQQFEDFLIEPYNKMVYQTTQCTDFTFGFFFVSYCVPNAVRLNDAVGSWIRLVIPRMDSDVGDSIERLDQSAIVPRSRFLNFHQNIQQNKGQRSIIRGLQTYRCEWHHKVLPKVYH